MYEISKFSTVNIREYLAESKDAEIGEDVLLRIFSDFSCPINPDVEQFLKERAIILVVRLEEKSLELVNWMRRAILTIYQHI